MNERIYIEFYDVNGTWVTSSSTCYPPVIGQTVYFRGTDYRVMSIDYILTAPTDQEASPSLRVNLA